MPKYQQIAHDSFARVTTYKQTHGGNRHICANCGGTDGRGKVHRYTVQNDDRGHQPPAFDGLPTFCSAAHWRTYNS